MAVYYIYGTSNSGSTFGIKGFYSPLYLTQTEANEADLAQAGGSGTSHAHTFEEVIGVTFYMPTIGMVHPSGSDQGSAPTGQFNGETYISYTSPISDADIEPINFGVLAGDTFNSWRRKTNEVARDAILNKASVSSLDTRFSRLIDVTGGENNIMTLTSSDNITGEKQFEGLVKFTAADDSTNGIQVGANGKIYVESSEFKFTQSIDLHTASKTLKASLLDVPTGRTKYANTTYTWPSDPPIPGQILKVLDDDVLDWDFEEAVQLNVDPFLIEDPNPIGSVIQWSEAGAPDKWKLCNGQTLNTYTYKDLHAVISNTYGGTAFLEGTTDQADVTTTFNVPNMGGRIPIGRTATGGTTDVNGLNSNTLPSGGFNVLGASGGEYKHALTVDELAEHTHSINNVNARNVYDRDKGGGGYDPNTAGSVTTESTGSNLAHNNIQPYIVLNYIIKTESSSVVVQNVTPTNGIQINGSHSQTNLLGSSTDPDGKGGANNANSITLDVDSEDFEFVNNQLKLVDTNYRLGEVIETFGGPCDGRSVTVVSGTHTLPDVNVIIGSNGTELLEGCKMNYTPPAGTKHVRLEITFGGESLDNEHIAYFYPSISTESNTTLIPSKYYSFSRIQYPSTAARSTITVAATYTIDSTISSENNSSIYNQILKSWTSSRAIGFSFNAHSTGYDVRLFEDHNQTTAPGSISDEFDTRTGAVDSLVEPHITITAIAG